MTTATPLSQEKWSWEPRFSIDILPIVSKEDKFAPLTQLSLVHNLSREILVNLGLAARSEYPAYTKIEKRSEFAKNLINLWIRPDSGGDYMYDEIRNSWALFFQVSWVDMYGKYATIKYVFSRTIQSDIIRIRIMNVFQTKKYLTSVFMEL